MDGPSQILMSEAYMQYVAAKKDSCKAAEDRFPTASYVDTCTRNDEVCRSVCRHAQ